MRPKWQNKFGIVLWMSLIVLMGLNQHAYAAGTIKGNGFEVLNQVAESQNTDSSTNYTLVQVRVKQDFAELSLSFNKKPVFTSAKIQDRFIVSFVEPINVEPEKIQDKLEGFVKSVSLHNNGKVFVFETYPQVTLDLSNLGEELVLTFKNKPVEKKDDPKKDNSYEEKIDDLKRQALDIAKQKDADTKPQAEEEKPKEDPLQPLLIRVRTQIKDNLERLIFEFPETVPYAVTYENRMVMVEFDKFARADFTELKHTPLRLISDIQQGERDGNLYVRFWTQNLNRIESFQSKNAVVVDVFNELRDSEKQSKSDSPMPPFPDKTWEQRDIEKGGDTKLLDDETRNKVLSDRTIQSSKQYLRIDLGIPASMAAFQRGDHAFIIFDHVIDKDWKSLITGSPKLLEKIELLKGDGWSGFLLPDMSLVSPVVARSMTIWTLDFAPTDIAKKTRFDFYPEPAFGLGPRFLIKSQDPLTQIKLKDPIIGDELVVIPSSIPGKAIDEFFKYPEFEIIPAYQGIVVRCISDSVAVRNVNEGAEVSSKKGLLMTQSQDLQNMPMKDAKTADDKNQLPVFDFQNWAHGSDKEFYISHDQLLKDIVDAPEAQRGLERMNFARFYMAHGYSHEAQAILRYLQEFDPDIKSHPDFKALLGASLVHSGDTDEAWKILNDPDIRDNVEVGLWLAAMTENPYYASELFYNGAILLDTYPEILKMPLSMKALEVFLKSDSTHLAELYLENIHKIALNRPQYMPAYYFYNGMLLQAQGKFDEAKQSYEKNRQGKDRYYRAISKLALINIAIQQKELTPDELVEQLEQMLFAWRDDEFEVDVARKLFDAYVAAGKYPQALLKARDTIALFPDELEVKYLPAKMSELFANVFLKPDEFKTTPAQAFVIYSSFSELTPPGAQGDLILSKLADRLVEIDLNENAIDILHHLVHFRLMGKEKAEAGLRLASIQLLTHQPEKALDSLLASEAFGGDDDLAAKRRLVKVKILTELKKYDEALASIENETSPDALVLKQDIAWKAKDWRRSAQYLGTILQNESADDMVVSDEKKAENQEAAQVILRRALALSMLNDAVGLAQMRDEYKGFMDKVGQGEIFNMVTRLRDYEQAKGATDAKNRISEVDLFDQVLKKYKSKSSASQ
jgi:tetratricopeptide (TPR) repeat protein